MSSFFNRMRASAGTSSPAAVLSPSKKDQNAVQMTALEKHLIDAGPLRLDGSDKFWGLENFGNTCYCNSILQCLYYSVPFREQVINYPRHTPDSTVIHTADGKHHLNVDAVSLPLSHPSLTYAKLMNKTNPQSPSARNPGSGPSSSKPEDKEHPDYKKKVALSRGPTIAMGHENAPAYDMSESLFTALKDIFEAIYAHKSRIGVVSPTRFLEVLKRENETFRSAMHQDAHEFLNILLNEVVTNVEAYSKKVEELKPPLESRANGHANGSIEKEGFEQALSTAMGKVQNNQRWVHELFEGTLTSETRCLTCENVSQRDEVFLDLSVDLEEHSSVTSCLRKFSEEEMLCEKNKFHCDRCGGLQEAEKRMKIKRLPKILALHLKRFKYTEDLQRLQKLFHRVVYPYHLRLFNTTEDAEDLDRLYELYAVVVHIGGGPYHGHYISIIKTEDRGWLLFDDELVEPVDKSYVQNFFGDRPGLACAYVLFYQETTVEAMKRDQDAETDQTVKPSPVDVPKTNFFTEAKNSVIPNGIHPVKSAVSPAGPDDGYVDLQKAVTEPPPPPSVPAAATTEVTALPTMPTSALPTDDIKSKKERVKEEKKEEKERRAKAKEEAKEAERVEKERRKTLEVRRKEILKKQDLQTKAAIEASKHSKLEEDQKVVASAAALTTTTNQEKSGLIVNVTAKRGSPSPTPTPVATGLSRLKSTSKSFKKPRFFGGSSSSSSKDNTNAVVNKEEPTKSSTSASAPIVSANPPVIAPTLTTSPAPAPPRPAAIAAIAANPLDRQSKPLPPPPPGQYGPPQHSLQTSGGGGGEATAAAMAAMSSPTPPPPQQTKNVQYMSATPTAVPPPSSLNTTLETRPRPQPPANVVERQKSHRFSLKKRTSLLRL